MDYHLPSKKVTSLKKKPYVLGMSVESSLDMDMVFTYLDSGRLPLNAPSILLIIPSLTIDPFSSSLSHVS